MLLPEAGIPLETIKAIQCSGIGFRMAMRSHEDLVRGNRIRDCLLSKGHVTYDPIEADRLTALHAARTEILGISWIGAKEVFRVFENLSLDDCKDVWGLPTIPTDWMHAKTIFTNPDSSGADSDSVFTISKCPAPMWWLVENIIGPQTALEQESMLFLLFGLKMDSFPIVGVANIFHSYTWGEAFADTFDTLNEAISTDVDRVGLFVWWDIFCQNQHAVGDVADTFKTAIKQVDRVLFSVPNLVRPQALKRVWCLFELTHSLLTSSVKLILVNKSRKQHRSYGNPLDYIVGVADADATFIADKDMLLALIETSIDGGCDAADKAIRELFIPCFVTQSLLDLVIDGHFTEMKALVTTYNMTDLRAVERQDKTSLLHLAAKHGHLEIVLFLLEHNADVNSQNFLLFTPLHEASRNGHGEVCSLLLLYGADVDAVNDDGESPLHLASHVDVVKVLLSNNADPTIENLYDELTPKLVMMLHNASPDMIALVAEAEISWQTDTDTDADNGSNSSSSDDENED